MMLILCGGVGMKKQDLLSRVSRNLNQFDGKFWKMTIAVMNDSVMLRSAMVRFFG